jgi:hypothetical protein
MGMFNLLRLCSLVRVLWDFSFSFTFKKYTWPNLTKIMPKENIRVMVFVFPVIDLVFN